LEVFRGVLSDALQDIGQIVVWVDAVQSVGDDQALQDTLDFEKQINQRFLREALIKSCYKISTSVQPMG
jgi:hypothetical protein